MNIALLPPPSAALETIWTYTIQQWGAEQANRYTDLMTAAFAQLARSSKITPTCDHIRPGYRRRSVERHMIYFRITTYGIAIVRILHNRMDASPYL